MKYVGAHVSIAGGVENAPENAAAIGAKAFAFFSKNQRQWRAPEFHAGEIERFKENCRKHDYGARQILTHDSYLINLGQPDTGKRNSALGAFVDELRRVAALGLNMLNFHPGSHLRLISEAECLKLIAECCDRAAAEVPEVLMVVENTAGQGSNVGYSFEQIGELLSLVKKPERMRVCIDTCHAFAAGYDWTSDESYARIWDSFDKYIGLENLGGMHLNDTLGVLGGRLDRHAPIGKGNIGEASFRRIMQDSRLDGIPLILETPEPELWPEEIKLLYSFAEGK